MTKRFFALFMAFILSCAPAGASEVWALKENKVDTVGSKIKKWIGNWIDSFKNIQSAPSTIGKGVQALDTDADKVEAGALEALKHAT